LFGYSSERRIERRLIREYERDIKGMMKTPPLNPEAAIALAELPLKIRGFGPVKRANVEAADVTRKALREELGQAPVTTKVA